MLRLKNVNKINGHSQNERMVEEIITALSRIRWLSVTARNSSSTYKGQNVDVKRAAASAP